VKYIIILIGFIGYSLLAQNNPQLQQLGREFFEWRTSTQPATGDDIPRVERPDGWTPDYSPAALQDIRNQYKKFKEKLQNLPKQNWSRADSVDFLLLRSAVERVNWELNILQQPYRNPDFYVHQTLGVLYELLLIHTPWNERRARNLLIRMQSIPKTVAAARQNLRDPIKPFARIAIENLDGVQKNLNQVVAALKPHISLKIHQQLQDAAQKAGKALAEYREWLQAELPNMSDEFAIGRDNYLYFLKNIALMPYTPEELLLMGRIAWNRSVSFETFEIQRNKDVPPMTIFASATEQIRQSRKDEEAIRKFLEERGILTIPDWLQHYTNELIPDYIRPFAYMGVVDDLTSPTRLNEDAVSYIPEPAPDLSFFRRATAMDPRPIIVHEGIPGHYFQLARSWKNPDPIRRHFFDSGPNEGIAFYVEEMLLQFGLFDNRPHTREIIYRFMRLRALRVEVDVQLALGNFTIEQAGAYLAHTVPMDKPTAVKEAGFFAYNPGQAISYQIGKMQIFKFLTDARLQSGDKFSLRDFHDYLMINGNVPISLLRWEYLGLRDEVGKLW